MSEIAFYAVADARYFLGAVGMINSLRLLGHEEPVYILDCGLDARQRELLASDATIVSAPAGAVPYLAKTVAPLRHPAEAMVLIDADMIATRQLVELAALARGAGAGVGGTLAIRNSSPRFDPRWGELLDLGPLERRPYVSSGLVVLAGAEGREVLRLLDDRQRRVDFSQTFYGADPEDYPFRFPEQDVLNAILCSRPEADRVLALDSRLAPHQPFRGLRLLDEQRLRCAYADGTEPYVLHHYLKKPWLEPMYHGIYSRLLARALLGEDVRLRVRAGELPLRMRRGRLALAERKRVDAIDLVRWYARDVIPERLGRRREGGGGEG